jgi:hypothetical protein
MKKTLLVLLISCATNASAQTPAERVDAANARCEAARQKQLEPLRARKIAQCKRRATQPAAGCETFYSTYGDNSNHANGSVIHGLFYDLPACVEARRISDAVLQKQNF